MNYIAQFILNIQKHNKKVINIIQIQISGYGLLGDN